MLNFNCHHVGTIQSFSSSNQTVTVTINYSKTFFQFNTSTGAYVPMLTNYPVIAECPIVNLRGGSTALTFPITVGDECLVLFNDRDLDNWFTGGTGSPNATARLHSYSDAIALIGVRSLANVLLNYDTVRALLRAGTTANSMTAVGVNPSNSKVLITNTYPGNSTTLNTLLQTLITDIKNLVTQTAAITVTAFNTPPTNAAAITAIGNSLTTVATQIGTLLE